jgi:hypothetical protein
MDAVGDDKSCSDCLGDVLNGLGGNDAATARDAVVVSDGGQIVSDGGILCGYRTGPVPVGADAGGPAIQCNPGWTCLSLNGGWACCTVEGSGGSSICDEPFLGGGG